MHQFIQGPDWRRAALIPLKQQVSQVCALRFAHSGSPLLNFLSKFIINAGREYGFIFAYMSHLSSHL